MKIETWGDLRDFLNTCNAEQLAQKAIVLNPPDETSITIGEAEISDTAWFYNEDSEGLIPVDDYDPEQWDGIPLDNKSYNTIVPPGRLFVYEEDFS